MDCGDAFAKILLFIFNLVVFICGIAIIIVGTVLIVEQPDYISLIGYEVWNICIALIVVGCVVTVVSFFGCCGAIKENTCMLYTFSAILSVILVAEVACVIVAFIYQGDITDNVKDELSDNMPDCKEESNSQLCEEWFDMQDTLNCCGGNNYTDWTGNWPDDSLPTSCCPDDVQQCNKDYAYVGCVDKVVDELSPYVWVIAGVGIGVAVLQILIIALACHLVTTIKKKKHNEQKYQSVPHSEIRA